MIRPDDPLKAILPNAQCLIIMMVIMVMAITWILKGLLLPVVGVAGVVGNAISLVVIHKVSRALHKSQLLINTEIENLFNEKKSQADLRLKASFLRLVTALSLYDTVDIITIIIFFTIIVIISSIIIILIIF